MACSTTKALNGIRPKRCGDGESDLDWIHTESHSGAVWAILIRGVAGETYLVGGDGERDNITVMWDILRAMGQPEDAFDWVRDRPGYDRRYEEGWAQHSGFLPVTWLPARGTNLSRAMAL